MTGYENEYKRRSDDDIYLGDFPIVTVNYHKSDDTYVEQICRDGHTLYGLRISGGRIIHSCVFDKVEFIGASSLVSLTIDGQQRIYDIYNEAFITVSGYCEVKECRAYDSIEIVCNGEHGLWDCRTHKLIVPIEYIDVTCNCRNRFLWVEKSKGIYDYIDSSTGNLVGIESSCGFDHRGNNVDYVYAKNTDGHVAALGLDGYEDIKSMRRETRSHNGRLWLRNDKTSCTVVVDIYGNIIKHF